MSKEISFPTAISIDDLSHLENYFKAGLQGIAICHHGIARSWRYAEYATKQLGTPSAFLEGGLDEISKLNWFKQKKVVGKLNDIPERYAILTSEEISQYANLLNKLQVCLVNCSRY